MGESETTKKFVKELHSGTTSLAVLALLVEAPKPMYGYEIGMELAGYLQGSLPINQGALYPVLRSLEKNGLLSSYVEPSISGPPRRYYSPTVAGREAAVEWQQAWKQTRDWLDSILETKHGRRTKRSSRSS